MRPLRDMNFPKFVFEVFLGLIGDVFPGLDCPRVHYPKFNDAMEGVPSDGKHIQLPHRVSWLCEMCIHVPPSDKLGYSSCRSAR